VAAVPLQPLPQPVNWLCAEAAAVSVTVPPAAKVAAQVPDGTPAVAVQLMPAGVLTTLPEPLPATVTPTSCGDPAKPASAFTGPVNVTTQVGAVSLHAPPQPVNTPAPVAAAVRVMTLPSSNCAKHLPLV
jgi:hypothetical protein